MSSNLTGVFAPILLTYDTEGAIDEEELRRIVHRLFVASGA